MGKRIFSKTGKSKNSIAVISGSDGPTSVFIARKRRGFRNIRIAIRKKIFQKKREKALAKLTPNPHTLEEVRAFIMEKYDATEIFPTDRTYINAYRNLKSALVREHAPELPGESPDKYRPADFSDEKAVLLFLQKSKEYEEKAASLDESLFPMDFHLYRIKLPPCGTLRVSIDFLHEHLSSTLSYSNSKSSRNAVRTYINAHRSIYAYYGVSKEDIEKRSQRLMTLLDILIS